MQRRKAAIATSTVGDMASAPTTAVRLHCRLRGWIRLHQAQCQRNLRRSYVHEEMRGQESVLPHVQKGLLCCRLRRVCCWSRALQEAWSKRVLLYRRVWPCMVQLLKLVGGRGQLHHCCCCTRGVLQARWRQDEAVQSETLRHAPILQQHATAASAIALQKFNGSQHCIVSNTMERRASRAPWRAAPPHLVAMASAANTAAA